MSPQEEVAQLKSNLAELMDAQEEVVNMMLATQRRLIELQFLSQAKQGEIPRSVQTH